MASETPTTTAPTQPSASIIKEVFALVLNFVIVLSTVSDAILFPFTLCALLLVAAVLLCYARIVGKVG